MPLRIMGRFVCLRSHGRVAFQVSLESVPWKSCEVMLIAFLGPADRLLVEPRWTVDVTDGIVRTFAARSSCSRFPGAGASRVRQMNLILSDSLLIRASIVSLLFRSTCTY